MLPAEGRPELHFRVRHLPQETSVHTSPRIRRGGAQFAVLILILVAISLSPDFYPKKLQTTQYF